MTRYLLLAFLTLSCAMAQSENGKVTPKITMLPTEQGSVTVLHLAAGYTSSVRFAGRDQFCGRWQSRKFQGGTLRGGAAIGLLEADYHTGG